MAALVSRIWYPGSLPVYRGSGGFLPQANATGVCWTMFGAANKIIYLLRFQCMIGNSAGANVSFTFNRNTSAFTGGTPVNLGGGQLDTNWPNPSATITAYTTAPTGGGAVSINYFQTFYSAVVAGAPQATPPVELDLRTAPIVLRSATQGVSLLLGSSLAGPNIRVSYEWAESTN